jgi:nucleotide-binding universal stress UspA family protein
MKLLMATGGSAHSEAALLFGIQIAKSSGEPPTVVTVVRREDDRSYGEAVLTRASEVLNAAGLDARTRLRVGSPSEEIVREAYEGGYDLVIVGERQSHGFFKRVLGSTAVHVVEHAPCPVIIAKGKIGPIRRILLCDSGGIQPTLLSRFTAQLAQMMEGDEEVIVLHVMSQITAGLNVDDEQLEADAAGLIRLHAPEGEILERDLEVLAQPHIRSEPKVRHGPITEEILEEAWTGGYDLVVIGAHRGQGWQKVLLADIAHQIITQVDRPVLVVR